MNSLLGSVISWNDKNERFLVKLDNGQQKYIKAINLNYIPNFDVSDNVQYASQIEFMKALPAKKNTSIDEMLDLFQNLEEEKYWSTHCMMKFVLRILKLRMKDTCIFPKLENILRDIIDTSKFDDLIVKAKAMLVVLMEIPGIGSQQEIVNISLECLENHYGFLPNFFQALNKHLDHPSLIQKIYFSAKHTIVKGTCALGGDLAFISNLANFYENLMKNGFEEMAQNEFEFAIKLAKRVISSSSDIPHAYLLLAEMEFQRSNYKSALNTIKVGQEKLSLIGNTRGLVPYYQLRTKCYISLGEKKLAKEALKYVKRFEKSDDFCNISPKTSELENAIKSMSSKSRQKKHSANIRTKTMCSWQKCKKIESMPGEFKSCGHCRLKYYCSRKCQVKDWKNGHKKKCKKS